MAKKNDKIRVRFVGHASHEVTGSCIHIQTENKQILLECGLAQSCESPLALYKKNAADMGFKPRQIDYIFIGHSHADHICLIPRMYKKGCSAKIIAPAGTSTISKILLKDSAHIAAKDAEFIEKRSGKFCEPLYDDSDVENAMAHWTEYDFSEIHVLDENISFRFTPSGHILNSAQIELFIKKNGVVKKIAYTSDLGNTSTSTYYVNEFKPIEQCNLLIGETTYSDPARTIGKKDRAKDLEKIKSVIKQKVIDGYGRVLFPVFANSRCQSMLSCLWEMFGNDENFKVPILVDSPMAVNISKEYLKLLDGNQLELYEKVFNWKNVKYISDYADSKSWQMCGTPAIILSSSGMMQAGRSTQHAARLLPSANNHILFCGYSAEGSLASKIKEGRQKTVRIEGKPVANRCGITSLNSFSSHAQFESLLSYYSNVNCEKIALVHGDYESKVEFAKILEGEIEKNNRSSRVVCVNRKTEILL